MDRNLHKKYIPTCPRNISIVDQYMWPQKDTNKYMCHNGISHPIYDCKGDVNFTLPLHMYPSTNRIHRQIEMVRRPHLQYRGSESYTHGKSPDEMEGLVEGFYYQNPQNLGGARSCPSRRRFVLATQRIYPGKLPDPSGWAAGRTACNSC